MKRKLFICVLLLTIATGASAQQDAMFSQYMFNTLILNPAYAGSRDVISMTALYRNQWVGIEGAPETATFSADMPIAREKVGLGLNLFYDKIGVTTTTGINTDYSFRIRLRKGTLAMGIMAGIEQYRADYSSVPLNGTSNPDPAFNQNFTSVKPNFGAGLYYSNDKFYAGVSVPHLLNYDFSQIDSISIYQKRHYFAMAGIVLKLSNELKLKPSTLIKYVNGSPLAIDLNMNLWIRNLIAIGCSYRTGDAVVALLELQATHNFRFGYAYDYPLTRIRNYSSGSHEFMLRYEFGGNKKKVTNPRYF